jgi:hypothetical protein
VTREARRHVLLHGSPHVLLGQRGEHEQAHLFEVQQLAQRLREQVVDHQRGGLCAIRAVRGGQSLEDSGVQDFVTHRPPRKAWIGNPREHAAQGGDSGGHLGNGEKPGATEAQAL